MTSPAARLRSAASLIGKIEDGLLCLLLGVMIFIAFGQIALRNAFSFGFFWADPLLRNLVLWVALLGAAAATRDDNHITIDILSRYLAPRPRAAARVVTNAFTSMVCTLLAWASFTFVREEFAYGAKLFGPVPVWISQIVLPLAFSLITMRFVRLTGASLIDAIRGGEAQNGEKA